jgi:hypothetical protein
MHAVLRVVPLAVGSLSATLILCAQPVDPPPIFATKPIPVPSTASAPRPTVARSGLSERMREHLTQRILRDAQVFEAPTGPTSNAAPAPTFTADGALLMPRFVVKSRAPGTDEVEPPAVPLMQFGPAIRGDRRVKGFSATLWRMFDGQGAINLNILKGAGSGVDSSRELTRIEIEFSYHW